MTRLINLFVIGPALAFPSQHSPQRSPVRGTWGTVGQGALASPLKGWLEDLFPGQQQAYPKSLQKGRLKPEQYPATQSEAAASIPGDGCEARLVRPLLAGTQLEQRPLSEAYRATCNGWSAEAFHSAVDSKGAAVVIATAASGLVVGGYNPKGWAGLGGARPSVAAFLFVDPVPAPGETTRRNDNSLGRVTSFVKLPKVGGGGLAIASDDPSFGVSFGPDGLVISLQSSKRARSKLGTYFQNGPLGERSLFDFAPRTPGIKAGEADLEELVVLAGVYEAGEEIPYSGRVLDMTSG